MTAAPAWDRALLALRLLACDPVALRGIVLRARSGPVREAFLAEAKRYLGHLRRIPVTITDDQLFGGIEIDASLAEGRAVRGTGLLARWGPFLLASADRATPALAARLAGALDAGQATPLIVLDEAAEADEGVPQALTERLALHIALDDLSLSDCPLPDADVSDVRPVARISDEALTQIARLAEALGVASPRAGIQAATTARAAAALAGRAEVDTPDIEAAVALVLVPRATRFPDTTEDDIEQPEDTPPPDGEPSDPQQADPGDDMLIAAAQALLPADLIARLAEKKSRSAKGSGSGAVKRSKLRGRPLPARPGAPDGRARIDLVATLRAAAPWQRLRRQVQPDRTGPIVRSSDIHLKRFAERADRLLIFVVDASGSAALTRLAEAKGAVELLLARAHAKRDHVALIAFRGAGAQVLLPPTRSLVRTKRELAQMPGGGTTPLAAGLKSAAEIARTARTKGATPIVAVLTDGRGNVALNGETGRAQAAEDAAAMARVLASEASEVVLIDTGPRPDPGLRDLGQAIRATYLALPRASAARISDAVDASLGG